MSRPGPLLTEAKWKKNRALASQSAQTAPGWPFVDQEPSCVGRDSVDSTERRSLAAFVGGISTSFHLMAAAAGLGQAGCLVEHLAGVSERVERTPAVERAVSVRQF